MIPGPQYDNKDYMFLSVREIKKNDCKKIYKHCKTFFQPEAGTQIMKINLGALRLAYSIFTCFCIHLLEHVRKQTVNITHC